MAAILANIMSCSVGTDEFQVTDLAWKNEPALKDGLPHGRTVSAKIDGWIDNDKLGAFTAVCGRSGQDVIVRGVNGAVLYSLPAARCMNLGPHVAYEQTSMKGGTAGSVNIAVTISAQTMAEPNDIPGGNPNQADSPGNEITYAIRSDGLIDVSVSGEASGPDADASVAAVVADVRNRYRWPGYVVKLSQTLTGKGDSRKFSISAERMAMDLPDGGGTRATEGTCSVGLTVDAEGVRTSTVSYDVVCDGDPMALESSVRSALDGKIIVSSNVEVSGYKERRLRCSYVVLSSDFLGPVTQYTESIEIDSGEDPTASVTEYDGVGVALVYNQAKGNARTFKQSGSAVGLRAYPTPPASKSPTGFVLSARPRIRYEIVDAIKHRTTWNYEFVGTKSIGAAEVAAILAVLFRPLNPASTPAVAAGSK